VNGSAVHHCSVHDLCYKVHSIVVEDLASSVASSAGSFQQPLKYYPLRSKGQAYVFKETENQSIKLESR